MTTNETIIEDVTAEQAVLGALLLNADAIGIVAEILGADSFYRPSHQTIYTVITDMHGQGEPADAVTVAAELERRGELTRLGGAPYLLTLLQTVPTAANASYYAEIVAQKHARRRLAELGARLTQQASESAQDVSELLESARAALSGWQVSGRPKVGERRIRVTPASEIKMRRLLWLWDYRVVLGGLTLLAGREGLGKSTMSVDLAAKITRGTLPGKYWGQPRSVIYLHSEDARDYTIVPRLVAAGADMHLVKFIDAVTVCDDHEELETQIVLPLDADLLTDVIREHGTVLVVLDAATSVIDGKLDGSQDRQMRQGLEKISRIAQDTGAAILGLVHFGKRDGADTGKLILGSIAWSQVARSVMALAADEEGKLVLSNTKANLAPADTPSLSACITEVAVDMHDGDEPARVGRVQWLGETDADARELLGGLDDPEEKTERTAAAEWLADYLTREVHVRSADAKRDALKAGFSDRTLQRARKSLNVNIRSKGFPRESHWCLPPCACGTTGTTGTTGPDQQKQDDPRGTTGGTTGEGGTTGTHSGATNNTITGMTVKTASDQGELTLTDSSRASRASRAMCTDPGGSTEVAQQVPRQRNWPSCGECGRDVYRSGATICAACEHASVVAS